MNSDNVTKQIRIERQKGYYGMFRTLKIVVDDEVVAQLKQSESVTLDLPIEAKEIWGKMDWGRTKRTKIDELTTNSTLVFKAYFTLNPLRNIGFMNMPFKVFSL